MTKRRDETLDVGAQGPDEFEKRRQVGMTPPVDRATPKAPPEPPITASQAIEIIEQCIGPMKRQLTDLHDLIMGGVAPNGQVVPGFGSAMHKTNNRLGDISLTTQATHAEIVGDDEHEPMAKRIAAEVANRMVGIVRDELHAIIERLEKLEAAAEHTGPNGTSPPKGL